MYILYLAIERAFGSYSPNNGPNYGDISWTPEWVYNTHIILHKLVIQSLLEYLQSTFSNQIE